MTVKAAQIAQMRRMVAEPTATTYSDDLLEDIIELYPTIDELGTMPYYWTQTGGAPTQTANANWIPTYNLNAAAAQIWDEKAAAIANQYDFKADGGDYSRSQAFKHATEQAKYYRSRRGLSTFTLYKSPKESASGSLNQESWIGNLPESDDFDSGDDVAFLSF
jgi:hypothetical protein